MAIAITLVAVYIGITTTRKCRIIINNRSMKSALLNIYARDGEIYLPVFFVLENK